MHTHTFRKTPHPETKKKSGTTPFFQPKLTINTPGDAHEREADQVADQVMRMKEDEEPLVQRKSLTPVSSVQRMCADCEEKQKGKVQRQETARGTSGGQTAPPIVSQVLSSGGGRPMDTGTRQFMEQRFGQDFGQVRIHTGGQAAESAAAIQAKAYTSGKDIVFGAGEYKPESEGGKRLLAHELVHVGQQGHAEGKDRNSSVLSNGVNRSPRQQIQRTVNYEVLDWDARHLGPPTPQNGSDPRTILIPASGQISISALVKVNGKGSDPCTSHQLGTTQTAWGAWTIMNYRGRTSADGSVNVRYQATMPMRDPSPGGSIWYDPSNVRSVATCGDSVGIFHRDSPWHNPPKARNNSAVAGNPLNYLHHYSRGLFLVTYLTAQDPAGTFLRRPLRFIYWNSIQNFNFTPQYPTPNAAPFLAPWPHTGQITVNIGSKGQGEIADAPYYTTGGLDFNSHFNTIGNWRITERTR